jgi:XTP/dITP diphosphohydrolase
MGEVVARLASGNPHKLAELRAALPEWRIELLETDAEPSEEGESSYYENARAKAELGRGAEAWSLGEDSGIEVAALGGRPGILSARYAPAGPQANAKLLAELEGVADRRARYVAELVALGPGGEERRGTGVLEGRVAAEPRGSGGFGYDPIFVPDGETRTVAELGEAWKRRHSHRARAARALAAALDP